MFKYALAAIVSAAIILVTAPAAQAAAAGHKASTKKHAVASTTRAKAVANGGQRSGRVTFRVRGKKIVGHAPVRSAFVMPRSAGDVAGLNLTTDQVGLASNVAFVLDQTSSEVLFEKNANVALPIASITKLMTGLVVVQAQQDMHEMLSITDGDIDHEKHTSSRLTIGARMTRGDLLHIALMSSENRAASALGRNYPGGISAFVDAMNAKAHQLGMHDTHYVDANGLSSRNIASARDLAKLAIAAYQEPLLREYSTDPKYQVDAGGRLMHYSNTNYLVASPDWDIGLQKTGFINEAGRCLVMQAMIQGRAVIMVFLDSKGKQSRTADAGRMRRWIEQLQLRAPGLADAFSSSRPAQP
ncbi:serine hydrolase [Massilia sp. PWRC2]|uniref:serine hydrolase n=1 Tax=Massilia sp. PWRC2 TaxID=2804626 RepID=UPI003CF46B63